MRRFLVFLAGREERYFDRFHVSPDGKLLVFVGTNGYLILVSSKVSLRPVVFCLFHLISNLINFAIIKTQF